jgi:FKBP-type peptidyl-prolyl cis-trans isomerase FklB
MLGMKTTLTRTAMLLGAGLVLAANPYASAAQAQSSTPAGGSAGTQGAAAGSSTTSGTKSQTAGSAGKTSQGTATAKPRPGAIGTKTPLTLKTDKDKESYAIGMNVAKSLKKDSIDIDPAILLRGLKDTLAGGKTLMTDDEAKVAMTTLQGDVRKRQEAKMLALGEANKHEGEAFLAANKAQEGVVTLPDGLQYKILKESDGPKPTASDSVVCNYRGTLLNNQEFDSSYKRGQPATFPVSGVIKGWTEVLQLMPVGSKWQIFVPADLAYGARGAGAGIPPNSTLVFEIELLSIKGKEDTKQPAAN